MKTYIRDNGKVRHCSGNMVQMNPLDYMYYNTFVWQTPKRLLLNFWIGYKKGLIEVVVFLFLTAYAVASPVLFPVLAFIHARKVLKQARKEHDFWNKKERIK
jgi:hypothetical protein